MTAGPEIHLDRATQNRILLDAAKAMTRPEQIRLNAVRHEGEVVCLYFDPDVAAREIPSFGERAAGGMRRVLAWTFPRWFSEEATR